MENIESSLEKIQLVRQLVLELLPRIDMYNGSDSYEFNYLHEMLTQHLLTLDRIMAAGDDNEKRVRYQEIQFVTSLMSFLERKKAEASTVWKQQPSAPSEDDDSVFGQESSIRSQRDENFPTEVQCALLSISSAASLISAMQMMCSKCSLVPNHAALKSSALKVCLELKSSMQKVSKTNSLLQEELDSALCLLDAALSRLEESSDCSSESSLETNDSFKSTDCITDPNFAVPAPIFKLYHEIKVTSIESPTNFWFYFIDDSHKKFNIQIKSFYSALRDGDMSISYEDIKPYLLVAANIENDWLRVEVVSIGEEIVVFLVDYATYRAVRPQDLRYLLKDFAVTPAKAFQGSLSGIHPSNGPDWSQDAVKSFYTKVANKKLHAMITNCEDDIYQMDLFEKEYSLMMVADFLIYEGHADADTTFKGCSTI